MKVSLNFNAIAAIIFFVAACSEPSEADKREKHFSELYEKAIQGGNYCEAYKVASIFLYMDDSETSQLAMARRIEKWSKEINESSVACKKALWPKIEASIHSKLDELKKYLSLRDVTATYLGSSLRQDDFQRNCVVDLDISNKSTYDILGFDGRWDRGGVKTHVSYESRNYRKIKTPDMLIPADIPLGFVKIQSGRNKIDATCDFKVYESIARYGGNDISIEIASIKLADNKKIVFSELVDAIGALEKQLSLGVQGVDLTKPTSVYQGQ